MGTTPDRRPGPLVEDEEIQLISNPVPPTQAGAVNFDGTSFKMRDAAGTFDPRSGSSGITEGQHEVLSTLVHDLDGDSYDEAVYVSGRVVSYTIYADSGKLRKIREYLVSYTGGLASQIVANQYDAVGALKMTNTETYTYSGSRLATVTRTKT